MVKEKPKFRRNEYIIFQFISYQVDKIMYDTETESYWFRLKRSGQLLKFWVDEEKLVTARITDEA